MLYQIIFRGTEVPKDHARAIRHIYETNEDLLQQLNNTNPFLDFVGKKRKTDTEITQRHLINKTAILHVTQLTGDNLDELIYY